MTRVAVISDIHGNCLALDAVLADLRQASVDQIVCLGDAIQGGAQPTATAQRLREMACPVVMGNADAWLLTGVETGNEPISEMQERVRQWSLAQLSPDDRSFIAAFAPTVTLALAADRDLLCFHGTPTSFDDILLPSTPSEEVRRALDHYAPAILTGGHTHQQQVRRLTDSFFFNPGSVGLACNYELPEEPFRRDPWAEYAILSETDSVVSLEFRRIPLPMEALHQTLVASGHPDANRMLAEYGF